MKNKDKTHYQILGIKKNASIGQIKVAYRKKIAQTHPDRQENRAHSSDAWRINLAYHTLKDPKRRAEYDRRLLAQSLVAGTPLAKWADNLESVRFDRQSFEAVAQNLSDNAKSAYQKMGQNLRQFGQKLAWLEQQDEPLLLQVLAWQAMLGETVTFSHQDKILKIQLPQGVQAGTLLKIKNDPNPPLLVQIVIINPTHLNNTQRQAWVTLKQMYQAK